MAKRDQGEIDAISALVQMAHKNGLNVADTLWEMGYRKDQYPDGKSKPELIARIEALEAERDKARNILHTIMERPENVERLRLLNKGIGTKTKEAVFLDASNFLTETSLVKP